MRKTITVEVSVTQDDMLLSTWTSILSAVDNQLENATRYAPDPFDSFPSCAWRVKVEEESIAGLRSKIEVIANGRNSSVNFLDESGEPL